MQVKATTDIEYTPVGVPVSAAGTTTLYTPSSGKRVRLHWIQAINDPVSPSSTLLTVTLGGTVLYVAWAISKQQQYTGPVDGVLAINLSQTGNVAVSATVEEV